MQSEIFPSKHGKFYTGLILAAVALVAVGFVQLLAAPHVGALGRAGWGLLLASAAGGLLWALAWTRYRVEDGQLVLRCGPFFCRLPLEDVEEIVRIQSLASSYALSRERLRIVLTGAEGSIDISPRDEPGFLRAVAARREDLYLTSEGLVTAPATERTSAAEA